MIFSKQEATVQVHLPHLTQLLLAIFPCCIKCILFIVFVFCVETKSDLSDKIFVENQLAIKISQLRDSRRFVFSFYCLYIFLLC